MYQFCISGAAKGSSVEEGKSLARAAGVALAKSHHMLMSGATVGLPNYTATAYKAAGGKMSLGLSPASSKIEHVMKYRLPTEAYDAIVYTGLHYIGRDTLLILSSDAVISVGGRLGTLHEFTIAMESGTPIGFLQGAGGISIEIEQILDTANSAGQEHLAPVMFSKDPEELIKKLTKVLDTMYKDYRDLYTAK